MTSYRKQQPIYGNASADPTKPIIVPLNRAARKRYAKARGLTGLMSPINKPLHNPKRINGRKVKSNGSI